MMLMNPPDDEERLTGIPAMVGPGGFAEPAEPIRVALARDEEAAGIESDATKLPPPAYGLWRESVVSFLRTSILEQSVNSTCRELIQTVSSGSATMKPVHQ